MAKAGTRARPAAAPRAARGPAHAGTAHAPAPVPAVEVSRRPASVPHPAALATQAPMERHLRTLPEQIAERVYAAIVSGEYRPGDRIREEALAEAYGVSRGPIREALRILERDSVLRMIPNRGAHVTRLSAKELNDIFEIRMVLAGAMVRRIVREDRALAEAIEPRVRELEAFADLPDEGAAYVAASVELSLFIAAASGNERLSEIMRSLARQSWRYTQLALAAPERRRASAGNWRALFEAIAQGRVEAAGRAMERLVDESRQEAVRRLEGAAAG